MGMKFIVGTVSLALGLGLANLADAGPVTGFDVVEDPTRRSLLAGAAAGRSEASQGYIYPKGTLAAGQSGVLANGHPAFPDLVIGTWSREARQLGAPNSGVAQVISHQVFAFLTGDVIVTEGLEAGQAGDMVPRAVTGATGAYAGAGAEMEQVMLSRDANGAMRARFHFGVGQANHKKDGFDAD